ncbi:MAG: glycoside hydrolase, partial [Deltaproteobacteria bacterium]|nr:glycoside hydrolase [Deltaproteobacteria bacterium]
GGAVVTLALDGENPWEHYPKSGEDFLTALYTKLSDAQCRVQSVLPREELLRAQPTRTITRLHSGSWIESSYRIWIGHPEDNEAWTQLGLARAALDEEEKKGQLPQAALERARDSLLAAEGSDWFWWYGDDFTTENAAEFDALFRRRVAAAFRALSREVPERVNRPIIAAAKGLKTAQDLFVEPMRLIDPVIDGFAKGYFEWQGAGTFKAGAALGGSMHHGRNFAQQLQFGFSHTQLFLRIDPDPEAPRAPDAFVVVVQPEGKDGQPPPLDPRKLTLRCQPHGALSPVLDAAGNECGQGQWGAIVELSVQLQALGLAPQERFNVSVQLLRDGVELERLPRSGGLALVVPDRGFEQAHWKV